MQNVILIPVFCVLIGWLIHIRYKEVCQKREKFNEEYAKFSTPLLHFLNAIQDDQTISGTSIGILVDNWLWKLGDVGAESALVNHVLHERIIRDPYARWGEGVLKVQGKRQIVFHQAKKGGLSLRQVALSAIR